MSKMYYQNKHEPRFSGTVSEQRHKKMSRIRGKDTSIEVKLRKALWSKGYRYRKNYKGLPGRPDIVLTKQRIAIFCDSEFFHGKDRDVLKPRLEKGSHPEYWVKKIERNIRNELLSAQPARISDEDDLLILSGGSRSSSGGRSNRTKKSNKL